MNKKENNSEFNKNEEVFLPTNLFSEPEKKSTIDKYAITKRQHGASESLWLFSLLDSVAVVKS